MAMIFCIDVRAFATLSNDKRVDTFGNFMWGKPSTLLQHLHLVIVHGYISSLLDEIQQIFSVEHR